jgi:hypothetical protein
LSHSRSGVSPSPAADPQAGFRRTADTGVVEALKEFMTTLQPSALSASKKKATPAANVLPQPGFNSAGIHPKKRVLVNGIAQFPVWIVATVGAQGAPAINSPFSDMPALLTDSDDASTDSDDDTGSGDSCNDTNATVDIQDSDSSASADSESENSLDGFIDTAEPELTLLQEKTLMRFFPIMCRSMIEKGV